MQQPIHDRDSRKTFYGSYGNYTEDLHVLCDLSKVGGGSGWETHKDSIQRYKNKQENKFPHNREETGAQE